MSQLVLGKELRQTDDSELSAGPGLLVRGMAVREIARGVAIGAAAYAVDALDAGCSEAIGDEARQVEVLDAAFGHENAVVSIRVEGQQIGGKLRTDLVVGPGNGGARSEEHTSELQSRPHLV